MIYLGSSTYKVIDLLSVIPTINSIIIEIDVITSLKCV